MAEITRDKNDGTRSSWRVIRGVHRVELALEMLSHIEFATIRRNVRAPLHTTRIDHRVIHVSSNIRAESHERVVPQKGQFLAAFSSFDEKTSWGAFASDVKHAQSVESPSVLQVMSELGLGRSDLLWTGPRAHPKRA